MKLTPQFDLAGVTMSYNNFFAVPSGLTEEESRSVTSALRKSDPPVLFKSDPE
jgi:hypothetical protein